MKLNADAEKLIKLLNDNGFEAYAVGGCVRDSLLNRKVGDTDITTAATPEQTEQVLSENGIRFVETGLQHGTVSAIIRHTPYEITTFRKDGEYSDNRHPDEVIFVTSLKEDLARRDFTMNALAYNRESGVVDYFGGIQDIKDKCVRAVGDPDRRFQEDALRIMRALRFAGVLGFTIEENTAQAIFRNKGLLKNIAAERIFTELSKLIMGDYCEEILLQYREVLAVFIPELAPCFDFEQHSKWHIYDVYTHIVKSVAVAPKKLPVRLALLMHDIAKPFNHQVDENGFDHFKGHASGSKETAAVVLKRLRVSRELSNEVLTLIEIHDLYITRRPSNIKKWLRRLGEEMTFDYIDVKIADLKTHNPERAGIEIEVLEEIRIKTAQIIADKEPYRIKDLNINGNDLLKIGYRGSEIAQELDKLINEVSGNPACNLREKLLRQASSDYNKLRR